MIIRHPGLTIFLLFGVVAPAELLEHFTARREPWWTAGLVLIITTIVGVLVGEWIATDAEGPRGRRVGYGITAALSGIHLLLDVACLAVFWLPVKDPLLSFGGVTVAAIVMTIQLSLAVRGLRDPMQRTSSRKEGMLASIERETSLLGGTAIAVVAVGLGFLAMVTVGLARHGWNTKIVSSGLFFGLLAVVGVGMGVERRAVLLGQPVPWRRWLPRLNKVTYNVTKEGLLFVRRRDAVLYRWEAIESVALGAMSGNYAVLISLALSTPGERIGGADLSRERAEQWCRRELRSQTIVRALCEADIAVFAGQTATGVGPLHAQIMAVLSGIEVMDGLPSAYDLLSDAEHAPRS